MRLSCELRSLPRRLEQPQVRGSGTISSSQSGFLTLLSGAAAITAPSPSAPNCSQGNCDSDSDVCVCWVSDGRGPGTQRGRGHPNLIDPNRLSVVAKEEGWRGGEGRGQRPCQPLSLPDFPGGAPPPHSWQACGGGMFAVALADPPQMAACRHHPAHLQLTRLFVWRRWKSLPGVQTLAWGRTSRGGEP